MQPSGAAPDRPSPVEPRPTAEPNSPTPRSTLDAVEDPYAGLSPEEIAVVENLDVLVYLDTEQDVEVLENLELLEELDELELEGPG